MFRYSPIRHWNQIQVIRYYNVNRFTRPFKYLNETSQIDKKYNQLTNASTETKINELLSHIKDKPELLYQLAFFFSECKKIGILPNNVDDRPPRSLKYWSKLIFKLIPLNKAFWETCYTLDIAQHSHRLNMSNMKNIGLLDPKNFPIEFYNQILTGSYNSINLKNIISFGFGGPNWQPVENKEKMS